MDVPTGGARGCGTEAALLEARLAMLRPEAAEQPAPAPPAGAPALRTSAPSASTGSATPRSFVRAPSLRRVCRPDVVVQCPVCREPLHGTSGSTNDGEHQQS